ncbi:hypothetical protein L1887_28718 [Cichorium endivia]|nr:hypothetical protein L1887_28718 [Cichorium endivia]
MATIKNTAPWSRLLFLYKLTLRVAASLVNTTSAVTTFTATAQKTAPPSHISNHCTSLTLAPTSDQYYFPVDVHPHSTTASPRHRHLHNRSKCYAQQVEAMDDSEEEHRSPPPKTFIPSPPRTEELTTSAIYTSEVPHTSSVQTTEEPITSSVQTSEPPVTQLQSHTSFFHY